MLKTAEPNTIFRPEAQNYDEPQAAVYNPPPTNRHVTLPAPPLSTK